MVAESRTAAEQALRALACGESRCRCHVSERRGRGKTHCPNHQDNNPSFGIDVKDGKMLCFCYGGCPQAAVVDAMKARDLWPEGEARFGQDIVATYDYVDAAGKLLYQAVRMVPKDFRQRRPAGGPDKWHWNLDDTQRVLYRFPELLHADPKRPRFIAEGEKDVDRLCAMGRVATCNVGGAGKWRPEYSLYFKDQTVVLLVDNDEAGRNHSLMIARSLNGIAKRVLWLALPGLDEHGDVSDWLDAGGTSELLQALVKAAPEPPFDRVREAVFRREGSGYRYEPAEAPVVMRFSRLADRRDETTAEVAIQRPDGTYIDRRRFNLLGSSGVSRDLIKILDLAQLGVDQDMWPSIIGQGFRHVIDAHRDGLVLEVIEGQISRPAPPSWLCDGLVMRNKMNCWLGAAGTGKSTLAKILCVCIATNHTFLGRNVLRGTPLYLDWEDDREDFERVIHDVCRWLDIWPVPKFGWIRMKGKRLRDSVESLSRHITELGASLMVIDSIAAAGGAGGENRGYEDIALELEQCLGQLPEITILGLDHITSDEHKNGTLVVPQKARGSERKVEIYRNQWTLMVDHEERQLRHHVVSWYHTKINADVYYPQFTVEILHETGSLSVRPVDVSASPETVAREPLNRQYEIYVQQNPGCTTDAVTYAVRGEQIGRHRDNVARELGRSRDHGVIERDAAGMWWPPGHPDMPRQLSGLLSGSQHAADLSSPDNQDGLSGFEMTPDLSGQVPISDLPF